VDTAWNAETTNLALQLIAKASRSDTQSWSHTRTALAEWGRRAEVPTASEKLPDILERCPADSPWRNALEHLSAIVDFRLAMHKELLT
jgi:leucyl aminopeptidase (aminopeptidase T)